MPTTVLRRLTSFGNQCCDYDPTPQHFLVATTPLEVCTFIHLATHTFVFSLLFGFVTGDNVGEKLIVGSV